MESNWRWEVWNQGLAQGEVLLCTRFLRFPFNPIYLCRQEGVSTQWVSYLCVPGQPPEFHATWPNGGAHFPKPYQAEVEPD